MKFHLTLLVLSIITVLFVTLSPFQDTVFTKLNTLGIQARLVNDADAYKILMLGDSMTAYLGQGADITSNLSKYYPDKKIALTNYGFGSKNILFAVAGLDKDITYEGATSSAILKKEFNLLIVESFANNPLSEYPLKEGLKKQTEALDQIVSSVNKAKPNAKIVFMATIAPSKTHFGEGAVELNSEQKKQWAEDRIAYLKNHIDYANSHHIPLINVYEKSLDSNGDGNIEYLNAGDHIHPSEKGLKLISKEIADFLYQNQIIPK